MANNGQKKKDITQTFSVTTIKAALNKLTGNLAKGLRGEKRGTRGISASRKNNK